MNVPNTIRNFLAFLFLGITGSAFGQESILSSGVWAKFSVEKSGVYKINYDLLKKTGIDPSKINPQQIQLYGNEGGMLPQSNNSPRPNDLQQVSIFVSGEDDGRFDKQDYILFYGQHSDRVFFDIKKQIYSYENNLYSDKNYYFITVGSSPGKRIAASENLGADYPIINSFNDVVYYELEDFNILKSGRDWLGEFFGVSRSELIVPFTIEGVTPGSSLKFVSDVMGQSPVTSSFKISVNNVEFLEQKLFAIAETPYGTKGIHKKDTVSLNASDVSFGLSQKQEVKYQFIKGGSSARAYLDKFLISFERNLALYGDQTIFVSGKSLENPVSQFQISSFTTGTTIWDITDHYNIKSQDFTVSNNAGSFSTATNQLKSFIVFNSKIPAPELIGKVSNQNLHGIGVPNLVIITHPGFLSEANRLAEHRISFNNYTVEVVTPEQIYNEFSSGRQDVTAIRDFAKRLYDKNPSTFKALLLFGKSSYDYKDRIPNNTNYICTYESRNSVHPLLTYSSDDYFAFLENNEGNWGEEPAQDHTLDIAVGRLPVTSPESAQGVVDKIINYDLGKKSLGKWRKQIVFVADDGNDADGYTSLHQSQADQLAQAVESLSPGIETKKLFIGTYSKIARPSGEVIPKLTDEIVRSFDLGSLIINYTGHGGERQLADENIFNILTIDQLENKVYPFLVTATCEFGRHDNPQEISGAERCVTLQNGGAIGMVTTARPVNATTNFNLNRAFYDALLLRQGNGYRNIGEVFRNTKNNSTSGVANRNFSLLGDPSMTLALPPDVIKISSTKTQSGSDTLKGLSLVTVKGEIQTFDGTRLSGFNGTVEATLFDKPKVLTTIGRNNPPFSFTQWSNALFRGEATVASGGFEFQFLIPKNISSEIRKGKLSLYADDPTAFTDANGFYDDFKIGGTEPISLADGEGPEIRLFMGDTTFIDGGITQPNTSLVVNLTDATGVNISDFGLGNNLIAILDDNVETYELSDYFTANKDDYTSGWINFPMNNLTPGRHTITVKAWDLLENASVAAIDFVVTDNENIVIQSFGNYPNPFSDNTTLFFTHNRSGDDLQAQLLIQSVTGELIKSAEIMIPESDYMVNLMDFNVPDMLNNKLPGGLYLARLIVRSLTNGSKNEQVTKLIILN